MIKQWTNTKSKYLKTFKEMQKKSGSVNALKFAEAINRSGTSAYNYFNYMIKNGLMVNVATGLFKLTEKGEQLYATEWDI